MSITLMDALLDPLALGVMVGFLLLLAALVKVLIDPLDLEPPEDPDRPGDEPAEPDTDGGAGPTNPPVPPPSRRGHRRAA